MDLISRQAAIDIERNSTVDTNPSHFEAHQKFMQFMDDAEISSFGRWQWSNGFNTALTAVGMDLKMLPSAQPEHNPDDERKIADLHKMVNCLLSQLEQRWNPYPKRPPKEEGRYQVTRNDYVTNTEFIDILWYEKNTWWNRQATGDYAVTAWMPLPKPYEGGENDD